VDILAMPSLYEIREIVKKSGKNTLREIEQATIEKLANKILRQFSFDLVSMLPAVLIIMLETRQASQTQCNRTLLTWLFVYFGFMVLFCFIRLIRIPVLQHSKYYFHYVLSNWILYYFTLFGVFVWGNIIFWANIRAPECQPQNTDLENVYDPKILWIIVGITLAVNWIAIFFVL